MKETQNRPAWRRMWGLMALALAAFSTGPACAGILVLQQGLDGYAGAEDTSLQQDSATVNWGARPGVLVGPVALNAVRSGLVRFDVSGLSGAYTAINSMSLRFYVLTIPANSLGVPVHLEKPGNAGWVEGTASGAAQNGSACWNRARYSSPDVAWLGGANGARILGTDTYAGEMGRSPTLTAAGYPIGSSFSITLGGTTDTAVDTLKEIVDLWVNDANNAGLLLAYTGSPNCQWQFCSKENTTAANRPLLTISATGQVSWNVAGSGAWDTSAKNWTMGTLVSTYGNGDTATFANAAGGTIAIAAGGVTPAAVTVSAAGGTYTFTGGAIGGSAALTKSNAGTLILSAATTYTGPTTINAGTLALGASGALSAASSVSLAAGATFDVSALTTYTLGSAASFSASGTGSAVGSTAAAIAGGTTVDLGSRPVTLAFTPAGFTGDTTHPALYLSSGSLTLNGQITLVNNGASPLGAGTYKLIEQASGAVSGAPTLNPVFGGQGLESGTTASVQLSGGAVNLVVVVATTTTTTLARHAGTGDSTTYGDSLTFDVTVVPAVATGTVRLKNGGESGTEIGTGTLSGGTCTITPALNALAAGSHANLVAVYDGDSTYSGSTSGALSPAQSVAAKALTVSGAVAHGKLYDGTTDATIGGTLNGVLSGDTVTLNGTGTFDNAGPGTGIGVTSTSTLGGASAINYTLTQPTGLSANILSAADAVWTATSGDFLWNTAANWQESIVGSGSGRTADFSTLDLTANTTVNLNSPRTIGQLIFGDTDTATAAGWTIGNNATPANILTLAGTTPGITVGALGSGKAVTIGAVVAGTAGLSKAGAGTLVLTGANTYGGGTTLGDAAGSLVATVSTALNALGGGAVAVGAGSAVQLNDASTTGTTTIGNTFTGAGQLTLNFAAAATARNTGMANVTGFGGTIRLTTAGVTGDKWHAPGINASAATLQINPGSQLYVSGGTTTFGSISVTGTGNNENRGAIRIGGATSVLAGNITLAGDATVGLETVGATISGDIASGAAGTQTLTVGTASSSGSGTLSGIIGGGVGTLALTKAGSGTLILGAANSYSGLTTINAGTLALSGGANRLPPTGTLDFSGSGILDVGSTSQTLGNLTAASGVAGVVTGGGGTLALGSSAFTLGAASTGNITLDLSGLGTFLYDGSLQAFQVTSGGGVGSGSGWDSTVKLAAVSSITAASFIVGGNGSANITDISTDEVDLGQTTTIHANAITVGLARNKGTLKFQSGLTNPTLTLRGADGVAPVSTLYVGQINSGGTSLRVNTFDTTGGTLDARVGTLIVAYNDRGNGGDTPNSTTLLMGNGTLEATAIILGKDRVGSTGGATCSGTLSVSGGTVKVETLTLGDRTGGLTVTGIFDLNGGGTLAAKTVAPGSGVATRTFDWKDGTLTTFDAGSDLTIGSALTLRLAATGTHTFDIGPGRGGTVGAILADATTLGTLVKDGAGVLTVTGNNTYTGGTAVDAGTLVVNSTLGSGTGAGAVLVNVNGTLAGSGFIGGAVTLAGTVSPGAGTVGTLTINNTLTVQDDSAFTWEANGTAGDLVQVNGDIVLPEVLNVAASGALPAPAVAFRWTGANSGASNLYNWRISNGLRGRIVGKEVRLEPSTGTMFTFR